jgi:hypothetical protein
MTTPKMKTVLYQVRQVLSVKRLPESADLVLPGGGEAEECDYGSFKLCSTSSVDSGRRDCLPHMVSQMFLAINRADVFGDKQGDYRTKT